MKHFALKTRGTARELAEAMRRFILRAAVLLGALCALVLGTLGVSCVVWAGMMVRSHRHQQRESAALSIRGVAAAAGLYAVKEGHCPSSPDELVSAGLITTTATKDLWGRGLHFDANQGKVRVRSFGEDGKPGGVGDDQDVVADVECGGTP